MKKLSLLSLLLFVSLAFSQEQEEKEKKKYPETSIYLGFSYDFNDSFAIDNKLESSGIPVPLKEIPAFHVGWSVYDKKFFMDTELTSSLPRKKSDSELTASKTKFDVRLRFHYNYLNSNAFILSAGLNLAVTGNYLSIYNNNNQVDLNNVNVNNSKNIYLYNSMLYVGPSLGFAIKSKKGPIVRITTGYEIAVASSKWKSEFASVSNSVNENGHGRILIGGVIYIL